MLYEEAIGLKIEVINISNTEEAPPVAMCSVPLNLSVLAVASRALEAISVVIAPMIHNSGLLDVVRQVVYIPERAAELAVEQVWKKATDLTRCREVVIVSKGSAAELRE